MNAPENAGECVFTVFLKSRFPAGFSHKSVFIFLNLLNALSTRAFPLIGGIHLVPSFHQLTLLIGEFINVSIGLSHIKR